MLNWSEGGLRKKVVMGGNKGSGDQHLPQQVVKRGTARQLRKTVAPRIAQGPATEPKTYLLGQWGDNAYIAKDRA